MLPIAFLIFLLLPFSKSYASDIPPKLEIYDPKSLACTEGIPSSIAAKHVSVVTGEFLYFQNDFNIPGLQPLTINRIYSSGNDSHSSLSRSWTLSQPQDLLYAEIDHTKKNTLFKIITGEPSGSWIPYQLELSKGSTKKTIPVPLAELKGFTNCGNGEICARSNLKNQKVNFNRKEKCCDIIASTGDQRHFSEIRNRDFNEFLDLEWEKKGNQQTIQYEHESTLERLSKISIKPQQGSNYSEITVAYNDKSKTQTFKADNGQEVIYTIQPYRVSKSKDPDLKDNHYLKKVESTHRPLEVYEYINKCEQSFQQISKISWPNDRFLNVEYYTIGENSVNEIKLPKCGPHNDSYTYNRVRALKAPVGNTSDPLVTHVFLYSFILPEFIPITDVYDAYHHCTTYAHDFLTHRLIWTERKTGTYPKTAPYSTEKFVWGKEKQDGYLLAKTVHDAAGKCHLAYHYEYDEKGNITTSHTYGNITGKSQPIELDKNGIPKKTSECLKRSYTFYDNDFNLPHTQQEGDLSIHFTYVPNTDLISSQLTHEKNQITHRIFYTYDNCSRLIKKVIDDGTSATESDTSGVTERHIFEYTNRNTNPCYGLPETEKYSYLDIESKKEIPATTTTYSYTKQGYLSKQEIRSQDNQELKSASWKYDAHGNVIEETNALDEKITRSYDANDNLIKEENLFAKRSKEFKYDFMNRLIEETVHHSDGTKLTTKHQYDYLGNRTKTTDHFGNETLFTYDEFSRLTSTIFPSIPDNEGKLVSKKETYTYDVLDRKTSVTINDTEKTLITYNAFGKPSCITYPDNTSEKFTYNLNGTLAESTEKNGTTTKFTYDYQKRVTSKERISSTGVSFGKHIYTYNTFHLISETDPEGYKTEYTYDGKGRKISETKEKSKTSYSYDALDRLIEINEWFGNQPHEYTRKCYSYDKLDRVLTEKTLDAQNNILHHIEYAYDSDGNRTQIAQHTSLGLSITSTEYDSHQNPILITDPKGNISHFSYNYKAINSFAQTVLEITKTDALGNITIITKNTHNKDARLEKRNSLGELLYKKEFFYDRKENCTKWIETVTAHNTPDRIVQTTFTYNAFNQLTSQTEAVGTPEQKNTQYSYNTVGQKSEIIKPDGTILYYTYDPLGKVASQYSSDHSIHNVYQYDLNDNLISVTDEIAHQTTSRTYDGNRRLLSETLANGLTIHYQYDCSGKLTHITLPDQSEIHYQYNPLYMNRVQRIASDGSLTYQHDYHYDNAGNVTEMLLANQTVVSFNYDLNQKITSINSPNWKEQLFYDPIGNVIENSVTDDQGTHHNQFFYDDLYQITSESGLANHTYLSDSHNNRLQKDGTKYSINNCNQLLHQGDTSYEYDLNGNLIKTTSSACSFEYRYDASDRLIEVILPDKTIHYSYDAFNRRISKSINGEKTNFLYLGNKEVGTLNSDHKIIELRILGAGEDDSEIGASVAFELSQKIYVPIHDHNGNIVQLLDEHGNVTDGYHYSAFGEEEIDGSTPNPWRYSSKRKDPETGLIYFGRRYYAPDIGRWITPDPKGFGDGPNLYAYVHNNPLIYVDLFGLFGQASASYSSSFTSYSASSYGSYHNPTIRYSSLYQNSFFCRDSGYGCNTLMGLLGGNHFSRSLGGNYLLGNPLKGTPSVGHTNGIFTDFSGSSKNAQHLMSLSPDKEYPINLTYSQTSGTPGIDMIRSGLSLYLGVVTPPVFDLMEQWNSYFANPSNKGPFLQTAHSEGCINVRNALIMYDEKLRQRINFAAFAPACYTDKHLCGNVVHYVSKRDMVPFIDKAGRIRNADTIVYLDPHPDAPLLDHSFRSPTYERPLKDELNRHYEGF